MKHVTRCPSWSPWKATTAGHGHSTARFADTVGTLINARRLANPGTVEYEAGGGNWSFERGQRLISGGFISATCVELKCGKNARK